jgi:hypothetical protein
MNQSDSFDVTEEIQKNIILYDACLNIFGERTDVEKQEAEPKDRSRLITYRYSENICIKNDKFRNCG